MERNHQIDDLPISIHPDSAPSENGLKYYITQNDNVTIIGTDDGFSIADLTIPETIEGLPVTTVAL